MDQFSPQSFNVLPRVVKNLIILNALFWLSSLAAQYFFNYDLTEIFGLFFPTSKYFFSTQIVTHMFMHAYLNPATGGIYIWHIFFNMFALWMFGSVLEQVWGSNRFFIFYILCGLGGALAHLGVTWWQIHGIEQAVVTYENHPALPEFATLAERYDYLLNMDKVHEFIALWKKNPQDDSFLQESFRIANELPNLLANIPILGASGAVFGVLVAFGVLFPDTYILFSFLFPIKAKYLVFGYAALELISGIRGSQDGIAHFAHLGGALVGFLLVKYWNRNLR